MVDDERVTIKHATASAFVFCCLPAGWRIGLIVHPIFGRLMLPGGHVEPEESAPEAALREVTEESGLSVRLVAGPAARLPSGFPQSAVRVPPPWWILEQPIPADHHLAQPHLHIDHLYVAVADSPEPVSAAAHPFGWHSAAGLAGLPMFADTRMLAGALFGWLAEPGGLAGCAGDLAADGGAGI
ncbi:MAG: NUDIX hydrolase [Streptosporangiaceae bacterium]|nr:NUDIX hydrolase [Actinomycetota bacterium]